jgi:hypothetical protein
MGGQQKMRGICTLWGLKQKACKSPTGFRVEVWR